MADPRQHLPLKPLDLELLLALAGEERHGYGLVQAVAEHTGGLLVLDMVAALVAANRMPVLEKHALERNVAFCGLFVIFMLIPIARFLHRPVQLFGSGMLGWGIFIVAYNVAGMFFVNLFTVLRSPLDALLEGAALGPVVLRQAPPGLEIRAQFLGGAGLRALGQLEGEMADFHVLGHRHAQRVVELGAQPGAGRRPPDVDQVALLI